MLSKKSFTGVGTLDFVLDSNRDAGIMVQVAGNAASFSVTVKVTVDGTNYATVQMQPIDGTAAVTAITANGIYVNAQPISGALKGQADLTAIASGTAQVSVQAARRA